LSSICYVFSNITCVYERVGWHAHFIHTHTIHTMVCKLVFYLDMKAVMLTHTNGVCDREMILLYYTVIGGSTVVDGSWSTSSVEHKNKAGFVLFYCMHIGHR